MLPYLEQTPLYQAANFSWGPWVNNDTVNNAVIAAFLCPSDPGAQGGAWNTAHTNSYNASYGTTTTGLSTWGNNCNTSNFIGCVLPDQSSGVFTYGIAYGFRDITDGTSNTVAFAEKLCGQNGQNYYKSGTGPGQPYRGNMVAIPGGAAAGANQVNAFTNPAAVIAALQTCARRSRPPPRTRGWGPSKTTPAGGGRPACPAWRCSTPSRPPTTRTAAAITTPTVVLLTRPTGPTAASATAPPVPTRAG